MIVMVANRTREIRPSGMKRGACGNVGRMGAGLRTIGKPMDKPPYPKRLRAPHFYPNMAVQTSTVKKSLAASTFQWALRKVDHVVRLLRSGDGSIPLRFKTLAIVPRPTL